MIDISPGEMLLKLLITKKGLTTAMNESKRLPGIPDRTLAFIAESAGGKVEKYITEDNKTWVRLTLGSHVLESDTNTRLLISVLELLK